MVFIDYKKAFDSVQHTKLGLFPATADTIQDAIQGSTCDPKSGQGHDHDRLVYGWYRSTTGLSHLMAYDQHAWVRHSQKKGCKESENFHTEKYYSSTELVSK